MSEPARAARRSDLFAVGAHDPDEPLRPDPRLRALQDEDAHGHDSNCAYCPLCMAIGIARDTKPEIVEHLTNAARELVAAAGLLIEEAGERLR